MLLPLLRSDMKEGFLFHGLEGYAANPELAVRFLSSSGTPGPRRVTKELFGPDSNSVIVESSDSCHNLLSGVLR
jgi:hypothetical protein